MARGMLEQRRGSLAGHYRSVDEADITCYPYLWTIDGKIHTLEASSQTLELSSQTADQTKQQSHSQRAD